jgi:hypothetical protein
MKKSFVLCCLILLMGISHVFAEDTVSEGKALNFPTKNYGISIGNSHEFTGIRINYIDKGVEKINGLNFTLWAKPSKNQDAEINGMSIGVIPSAGSMQYINLGLVAASGASHGNLNGVSIGGLAVGNAHGDLNGVSVGGLMIGSGGSMYGLSIAGLFIGTDEGDIVRINGITVAGLAIGTDGDINGVASSLACLSARKNRGLAVTAGYLSSEIFKGVAIAGYSKTDQMHGLSVALYNEAEELHGVQFGLLNYAKNNPKGLRLLPFINLHL